MSKLRNRILVKRGGNLPSELYSFNGDYLRLTLANFYETGGFKKSNLSRNVYFVGDIEKYVPLEKNTLITPLTEQVKGLLGSMALIPESNKYIPCGDIGIIEILDKSINKSYLYHLFKYDYIRIQLVRGAQKSKIRHVSANDFYNIEWDFPELRTQEKIGQLLDKIDDKIELNNKINLELENMAKIIYDYWFLQFEFPNDEGKPYKSSGGKMVWNEELKKEIPEGWENGNLYDIASFINGLACQKYRPTNDIEKLPVIKISEMHNGITDKTEFVSSDIPEKYIIDDGDILFSWSATLETMIWTGGKGGLNQHIFKVNPIKYSKYYVFMQLSIYILNFIKIAEARKTTMGHITTEHLKQSKILLPEISIIDKFHNKVNKIFKEIIKNSQEIRELTSLKNYLLPLLMNGQIGFKD